MVGNTKRSWVAALSEIKNSSILLGSSLDSRCLKNKNKKSCFWKSVKLTRFARLLPLPAYKSSRERCWSLRGVVLLRRDSGQTSCRGRNTDHPSSLEELRATEPSVRDTPTSRASRRLCRVFWFSCAFAAHTRVGFW